VRFTGYSVLGRLRHAFQSPNRDWWPEHATGLREQAAFNGRKYVLGGCKQAFAACKPTFSACKLGLRHK
jgi:hypothetical protein